MKYNLFLGPYPPPLNGHSFAFKKIIENYKGNKLYINQNFSRTKSIYKIIGTSKCIFLYLYFLLFKDIKTVYCAGSRSLFGSFKDVVAIHIFSIKKRRIILHIHAANFDMFLDEIPSILKRFYLSAYYKVDVFILLMDNMKKEYEKYFLGYTMLTISNFYEESLDELPLNLNLKDSGKLTIIYLSNIIYSKGIIELLKAFFLIEKEFSNVKLEIAGEFSDDDYLNKDEIRELFYKEFRKLKNSNFHGPLYGDRKRNLLSTSDIFILPSFYSSEAVPISIIEAMRAGNAIITTRHHYLDKLVGNENGKCVDVRDYQGIYDAIKFYLFNRDELRKTQQHNINFSILNYKQEKYVTELSNAIDDV